MFLLSDIITYVRRIVKTPSNAVLSDNLIIDYINRFWITDIDARMQLFDLKTKYQFQTTPGVDQYNMPMYNVQTEPGSQTIGMFPKYQGFLGPAYVNGIRVNFYTQKDLFYQSFPNVVQNLIQVGTGDGTTGPYSLQLPILSNPASPLNPPITAILRGHVDITGVMATNLNVDPPIVSTLNLNIPAANTFPAFYLTAIGSDGSNVVVSDSGQFLSSNQNLGLLMVPGSSTTLGNTILSGGYSATSNTVNYLSGQIYVTFPSVIPSGTKINAQCLFFQTGLPRAVLYYNNTLTFRVPPSNQYLVELDAYLSPAALLNTSAAVPFGYMSEYIARGAARKILADTGDMEQFQFYEPLFQEQEALVHIRSQRQFTSTRTETIYSRGAGRGSNFNQFGGGATW